MVRGINGASQYYNNFYNIISYHVFPSNIYEYW